jgi:hypothetical protein
MAIKTSVPTSNSTRGKNTRVCTTQYSGRTAPAIERFKANLDLESKPGCWLLTYGQNRNGYPHMVDDEGKTVIAHRWAYMEFIGPIPEGQCVLHKASQGCSEDRRCCNPKHLGLGSPADNAADLKERRTREFVRTSKNVVRRPRLSEETVAAIRRLKEAGMSQYRISETYGVSEMTISLLVRGKTYAGKRKAAKKSTDIVLANSSEQEMETESITFDVHVPQHLTPEERIQRIVKVLENALALFSDSARALEVRDVLTSEAA